jgi:hypothetical protein
VSVDAKDLPDRDVLWFIVASIDGGKYANRTYLVGFLL